MNPRRLFVSAAALGLWLLTPTPAAAHRLDEYLQATRLSINADRVDLEIDLTAGVAVAPEVFNWIDTNRDGRISTSEGDTYARQLLHSVSLTVDGRAASIELTDVTVPQLREMGLGVGTIQVRATARIPAGAGRHRLSYLNTYRPDSSVYLVNALVPASPRIQITGQDRDRGQHRLTLEYNVKTDSVRAGAWSLLAAMAMAGVLGVTRWPRRNATA